jgi:hypothetical protein
LIFEVWFRRLDNVLKRLWREQPPRLRRMRDIINSSPSRLGKNEVENYSLPFPSNVRYFLPNPPSPP